MSTGVNSSSPTRGAIDSRRDLVMDQIFFPPLSDKFFAGVIACILIPLFAIEQSPTQIFDGYQISWMDRFSLLASTIEFQEVILSPLSSTDFKNGMMCLFFANYRTPAIIKKENALNMVSLDF